MPRRQVITLERVLGAVGAAASIIALIFVFFSPEGWSQDAKNYTVLAIVASAIVFLLYPVWRRRRPYLSQYAQAVYYTHYINHVVRDFISDLQSGRPCDLASTVDNIADAVADCFEILTGRRCRCAIKEVTPDRNLSTVTRDTVSKSALTKKNPSNHPLDKNSDFADLWYGRNNRLRYYLCNDLIKLFKLHKYENTSFETYGRPEVKSMGGFSWVEDWKLPYRATIIWPIRHIPNHDYWPPEGSSGATPPANQAPDIWGFLCVDCNERHIFDETYAPELGAGFADALYTLFSVANRLQSAPPSAAGPQRPSPPP